MLGFGAKSSGQNANGSGSFAVSGWRLSLSKSQGFHYTEIGKEKIMSDGQLLSSAAVACYRKKKSEKLGRSVYSGMEWGAAVAQAMASGAKGGKRKDRRDVAEELTAKIFDKARGSSISRLDRVAACVGPDAQMVMRDDGLPSELEVFAREVMDELTNEDVHNASMGTDTSDLISGIVDISSIISLIMGIISAIRQCRNPAPAPTPVPA